MHLFTNSNTHSLNSPNQTHKFTNQYSLESISQNKKNKLIQQIRKKKISDIIKSNRIKQKQTQSITQQHIHQFHKLFYSNNSNPAQYSFLLQDIQNSHLQQNQVSFLQQILPNLIFLWMQNRKQSSILSAIINVSRSSKLCEFFKTDHISKIYMNLVPQNIQLNYQQGYERKENQFKISQLIKYLQLLANLAIQPHLQKECQNYLINMMCCIFLIFQKIKYIGSMEQFYSLYLRNIICDNDPSQNIINHLIKLMCDIYIKYSDALQQVKKSDNVNQNQVMFKQLHVFQMKILLILSQKYGSLMKYHYSRIINQLIDSLMSDEKCVVQNGLDCYKNLYKYQVQIILEDSFIIRICNFICQQKNLQRSLFFMIKILEYARQYRLNLLENQFSQYFLSAIQKSIILLCSTQNQEQIYSASLILNYLKYENKTNYNEFLFKILDAIKQLLQKYQELNSKVIIRIAKIFKVILMDSQSDIEEMNRIKLYLKKIGITRFIQKFQDHQNNKIFQLGFEIIENYFQNQPANK